MSQLLGCSVLCRSFDLETGMKYASASADNWFGEQFLQRSMSMFGDDRTLLVGGGRGLLLTLGLFFSGGQASGQPVIMGIRPLANQIEVDVRFERGFDYVALRVRDAVTDSGGIWVSTAVDSQTVGASFLVPALPGSAFYSVETGNGLPPQAVPGVDGTVELDRVKIGGGEMAPESQPYHVLNRLGYGPSSADLAHVKDIGVGAYVREQLAPGSIEETDPRLTEFLDDVTHVYRAGLDTVVVPRKALWRYFKGTETPPSAWRTLEFDANAEGWLRGAQPMGRGVPGLATNLSDMQQNNNQAGYVSVFMRHEFEVADPSAFSNLILRTVYDDGFVAYLNGKEVARANVETLRPAHHVRATEYVDYPLWEEFELDPSGEHLQAGTNVLAIQLHNARRDDFDSLMDSTLVSRAYQSEFERVEIDDLESLKDLLHARGIYSKRQLQATLGEFWENHFTTDYDKVAEYLDDLEDLDGNDLLAMNRAEYEAVQMEFREYEFFYRNALGNFGDLLLYSATSPSQLIYLDNVLNRVGEANENYAREILELFAFGVDNRYTQADIEQLSRAFTGWQIRKVRPDRIQSFPDSAISPPTLPSIEPVDTPLFDADEDWRFFRGTRAPSRSNNGQANTAWTTPTFRDGTWERGGTPLGYDTEDPVIEGRLATNLSEMQGSFSTVYLRRPFRVENPEEVKNLLLSIKYDDGYVAYLNGVEIGRSESMDGAGRVPSHRFRTSQKHLATNPTEFVEASRLLGRLRPAPAVNVLAIEVHNSDSMDTNFYVDASLVTRSRGEGSIEPSDPNGLWTFRFNPEEHDYSEKILFEGTEHEIRIPAGREGGEGLRDALDVIESMVDHPSTSEFISLKLINRFVSDDISLRSYHERTAPEGLLRVMDAAINAWHSTEPAGNIATVLAAIFEQSQTGNYFWSDAAHQAKVRTPIEYVNSVVRALDWQIRENRLPQAADSMGMHFFTRNDPDGWSEKGFDWMNTGGLLERLNFSSGMPRLARNEFLHRWSVRRFLIERNIESAKEIVDYFDELLFEGSLTEAERNLFVQFANTKPDGNPSLFRPSRSDYFERAGDLIGLILSTPRLQFQ